MSLGTEEACSGDCSGDITTTAPGDNPATVFQILVNVPPICRLICEWPHGSPDRGDRYYFTQLADLDK